MKIIVDESPVGVGKTHNAIRQMLDIPGRYLFAVEKVEAIAEVASRIFAESRITDHHPRIERIHSKNNQHGSVSRQVDDLVSISPDEHVIALITHEGLMMNDFHRFEGWSLIVDEVPSMFVMNKYRTPTDVAFFEENYTLTPVYGSKWHLVGLTEAGKNLNAKSIANCEGHRYLFHFHRRCRDPRLGPVVDLTEWKEMSDTNREWSWWSLFHPAQIASFTNITFLGSGFTNSLSFAMFNQPDIEWQIVSSMGERPLKRRNARIVFYSERPTSLFYLRGANGQADLAKIAAHIAATTTDALFWSANESIAEAAFPHLGEGNYRTPRQAGTSLLMNHDTAAMFYAAKPSGDIEAAIGALGCSAEQWVTSNEYETILQFLTRTSVRDVSSDRDVTLHVFNRDQADYLKAFFDAQPHITATLEKVDLDLSTQQRKAPGRPMIVMTEAEREAKEAAQREKRKLAMRERRAKAVL